MVRLIRTMINIITISHTRFTVLFLRKGTSGLVKREEVVLLKY